MKKLILFGIVFVLLVINVNAQCFGSSDFNGDGVVNVNDFDLLKDASGKKSNDNYPDAFGNIWNDYIKYDLHQNGIVDLNDFFCFADNYKTTKIADFNFDGFVDLDDFFIFADFYGGEDSTYDLNGDGRIDLDDFFAFADQFGNQYEPSAVCDSRALIWNSYTNECGSSCSGFYHVENSRCVNNADFNSDGRVDLDDFFIFADTTYGVSIGNSGYNPLFDLNQDRIVDLRDFDRFKLEFGFVNINPCGEFAHREGNLCVPNKCNPTIPNNAVICPSDNINVPENNLPNLLIDSCGELKCEYTCSGFYHIENNGCVNNADFNSDGRVDLDDFFAFANQFGLDRTNRLFNIKYDLNNDEKIDFGDFDRFKEEYGGITLNSDVLCGEFAHREGNKCVSNKCDQIIDNAVLCSGDGTNIPERILPSSLVNTCTELKCEFMCNTGYEIINGVCAKPTCNDGIKNQEEVYTDCGGPNCQPCRLSEQKEEIDYSSGFSCGNLKYGDRCVIDLEIKPENVNPGSTFKFGVEVESSNTPSKKTQDYVIKMEGESGRITGNVIREIKNSFLIISGNAIVESNFENKYKCSLIPNPELCCGEGFVVSEQDPSICVRESSNYCVDFNRDNKVNMIDFFMFKDNFGNEEKYDLIYDLNNDGVMNFDDFFIFADSFGKEPNCN